MKVYIISNSGQINTNAFTSLKATCRAAGVSYASASKGKRLFKPKDPTQLYTHIIECELIKNSIRIDNLKGSTAGRFKKGSTGTKTRIEPNTYSMDDDPSNYDMPG